MHLSSSNALLASAFEFSTLSAGGGSIHLPEILPPCSGGRPHPVESYPSSNTIVSLHAETLQYVSLHVYNAPHVFDVFLCVAILTVEIMKLLYTVYQS